MSTHAETRLVWPPPGLERIHGQIWNVIGGLGIGGAIMVGPLLYASATYQPFWSTSGLGAGGWTALAVALLDFFVLLEAYLQMNGMLRDARRMAAHGYGWRLIMHVAADQNRNAGALMTGTREFAVLSTERRSSALGARLFGTLAYLAGVLWLPVIFPLSLLLAAVGLLSAADVWMISLLPAALLLLAGLIMRAREGLLLRPARHDPVHAEPEAWSSTWDSLSDVASANGRPRTRALAATAALILFAIVLLFVPLGFAVDNMASRVLAGVAGSADFRKAQQRLAAIEALRAYEPPDDPAITPDAAGAAVYNLIMTGDTLVQPFMRVPQRRHPRMPDAPLGSSIQLPGAWWPDTIVARGRRGLTPAQLSYLEQLISHPALRDLETLGRAESAEWVGSMLELPLPDTINMNSIPFLPRLALRNVARVQLAKAGLLMADGRYADARVAIDVLIGAGFLMIDTGRFFIDALIGAQLVNHGADALELLFRTSGDSAAAISLAAARSGAVHAARIAQAGRSAAATESLLEDAPKIVLDPDVTLAHRWETFALFTTYAPCLNQHNVLFGLDDDYEKWLLEARAALVRTPADAELFAIARHGYMGTKSKRSSLCGAAGALVALRNDLFQR